MCAPHTGKDEAGYLATDNVRRVVLARPARGL